LVTWKIHEAGELAQRVADVRPPRHWRWYVGLGVTALLAAVVVPRMIGQWPLWLAKHRGEGARLVGADLSDADLSGVSLKRANLRRAILAKARCFDTDFRHADLERADLKDALLEGADLRGARLQGARLAGAVYDAHTRWPAGFRPRKHGAVNAHNWSEAIWRSFGRPPRR
jgi:hypothetical protein